MQVGSKIKEECAKPVLTTAQSISYYCIRNLYTPGRMLATRPQKSVIDVNKDRIKKRIVYFQALCLTRLASGSKTEHSI